MPLIKAFNYPMYNKMISRFILFTFAIILLGCVKNDKTNFTPDPPSPPGIVNSDIQFWLSNPARSILFKRQSVRIDFSGVQTSGDHIIVDTTSIFQEIDGFGNCLTGGSALLLNKMSASSRAEILEELFGTGENGIGISYLRISIGASDLSDRVFSYNDLAPGETDPEMLKFSLEPEQKDLIPVLKEILKINPSIKIMGSPWSAPVWMKDNGSSVGGSLKKEFYPAYAKYFVKYIEGMAALGITIDAITIQNEPLHPGNNPSMYMTAADQALFIKNNLGPAFASAGIKTKIIIWDHNCDVPEYPLSILSDRDAAKYVDGSAFHLYGGTIEALSTVHNAHPSKNVYFTEQWVGGPGNIAEDLKWHTENLIIGATRNWSRNVLEWNLASDPSYDPHTLGGCTTCLGTITIAGNTVTRNPAYYILAHAAKFVRPGSKRIGTNMPANLPNVAFKTADGQKVLIVLNNSSAQKKFNIVIKGKYAESTLDAGAVGTYIWK